MLDWTREVRPCAAVRGCVRGFRIHLRPVNQLKILSACYRFVTTVRS